MNLEEKKNRICDGLEKQYGIPLGREFRRVAGDMGEEDEGSLVGDPEAEQEYLDVYREMMERKINELLSWLRDPKTKSLYSNSPYMQPTKKQRGPYTACFDRRFYIAEFVTKMDYRRGSLTDWNRLSDEWNKLHPESPINKETLRSHYKHAIKDPVLMFQLNSYLASEQLNRLWQPLEKQLRDMAHNNPFSYVLASLVSQKMWSDTQPLILSLTETIKKSPIFKEIEAQDPERAALINSKLEALVNIGDIRPIVEDMGDIEFSERSKLE